MAIKKTTNINIAIGEKEKQALKVHLEQQGATLSALARQLISQYMEENNVKPQ